MSNSTMHNLAMIQTPRNFRDPIDIFVPSVQLGGLYYTHDGKITEEDHYTRTIFDPQQLMTSELMAILEELRTKNSEGIFLSWLLMRPVEELFPNVTPYQVMEMIIAVVAQKLMVTEREMCSPSRKQPVKDARQIAMTVIKAKTNLSLKVIGERFGGRDHTTVINAIAVIKDLIDTDASIRANIHYFMRMDYHRLVATSVGKDPFVALTLPPEPPKFLIIEPNN